MQAVLTEKYLTIILSFHCSFQKLGIQQTPKHAIKHLSINTFMVTKKFERLNTDWHPKCHFSDIIKRIQEVHKFTIDSQFPIIYQ